MKKLFEIAEQLNIKVSTPTIEAVRLLELNGGRLYVDFGYLNAVEKAVQLFYFDEENHEYTLNGKRLPSVTEVLSTSKLSFKYLEGDHAARGTWAHWVCHLVDLGLPLNEAVESVPAKWRKVVLPYCLTYTRFLADVQPVIIESEKRLHSEDLWLAGTMDRYIQIGDECGVLDIKTGIIPATVGMQTAAYDLMRFGNIPDASDIRRKRWALGLAGDGKRYKLVRCSIHRDYVDFLDLLGNFQKSE